MGLRVAGFETTPNPRAIKCLIEGGRAAERPRSYFNAAAADEAGDDLARALFAQGQITNVLIHQRFITICKTEDAGWGPIKKAIKQAVADWSETQQEPAE